jgi:hypothetical protein
VAITEEGLKLPSPSKPSFRETVLFKPYVSPQNVYFYDPEVTDIFESWCADVNLMKNFEFRERILKAAMKLFKSTTLYLWSKHQGDKPTVSAMHGVFIMQTLEYLVLGKEREINVLQWCRLLETGNSVNHTQVNPDTHFRQYKPKNDITLDILSDNIKCVRHWVSQPDGYVDLLATLYAIFGRRDSHIETVKV